MTAEEAWLLAKRDGKTTAGKRVRYSERGFQAAALMESAKADLVEVHEGTCALGSVDASIAGTGRVERRCTCGYIETVRKNGKTELQPGARLKVTTMTGDAGQQLLGYSALGSVFVYGAGLRVTIGLRGDKLDINVDPTDKESGGMRLADINASSHQIRLDVEPVRWEELRESKTARRHLGMPVELGEEDGA